MGKVPTLKFPNIFTQLSVILVGMSKNKQLVPFLLAAMRVRLTTQNITCYIFY